jgi:RNA-directed DNA polymerase
MRLLAPEFKQYNVPPVRSGVRYPQPFDDRTLALATGISLPTLWYFVWHAHALYKCHTIPKKSGGKRLLHVPDDRLARAQTKILKRILNCVDYPKWVSAYVQERSTIDAAAVHANRQVLVVVDIKDFFLSTKRAWVRDALEQELGLERKVSEILATLLTAPKTPGVKKQFIVPQGAPTSGAVANLVAMHRLDPLVLEVCEKYDMDYTRYADDLAFSRESKMGRGEASAFVSALIQAVRTSGYRVNYEKIRVQRRDRQQRLLGLTINSHPNYPKKDYRRLRALVHHCVTRGFEQVAQEQGYAHPGELEAHIDGLLTYLSHIAPDRAERLRAQLEGKVDAAAE